MVQREMEFSGLRDVDFPVSYQSRNGKTGRHRATLSGLGSWVGARVASPRCPILRPDLLSVPRSTATVQIPPSRTWLAAGRWPSPVSAFVRPRLPRPDLPACWQGCGGILIKVTDFDKGDGHQIWRTQGVQVNGAS